MTTIEPSDLDPSDVVIQPRCPHCGIEHYCLNVLAISYGHARCGRCQQPTIVYLRHDDYRRALRAGRPNWH